MAQQDFSKHVFLIDGSSFLYRAYYAMRPLNDPKGDPVQAVYGFIRMINKLMKMFEPKHFVLVWDSKGKTERHEEFPEYKATRQAPPSDLFEQKKIIVQFADLIGLKQIAVPGIEADDIIYSLARDYHTEHSVIVISPDKDLYQMINGTIEVYDPFKDQIVDVAEHEAKIGFSIHKMPFYFSLLGDSSDNIPGVRGIGKKGATDLAQQFESLEDMYERIEEVPRERIRNLLLEGKENAFLSRHLFLLRYKDLQIPFAEAAFDSNKWSDAAPLFQELGFRSLLTTVDAKKRVAVKPVEDYRSLPERYGYNFHAVTTEQALAEVIAQVRTTKLFACDTEGTGLWALRDEMVGISIAVKSGESFYIPFGHKGAEQQLSIIPVEIKKDEAQLSRDYVLSQLKPIFEDPTIKKVFQNATFDMLYLYQYGIRLRGLEFDTMIGADLVLSPGESRGLKQLSQQLLGEEMQAFKSVLMHHKVKDFSGVPIGPATAYAAGDAHQTLKLYYVLLEKLKQNNLLSVYESLEGPLVDVLFAMEAEGIIVDKEILLRLDERVSKDLDKVVAEIRALTGLENINLNSPAQVSDLLFNQLQLPPQKKSAKRTGYSTDSEVLRTLAELHPVPKLIERYRELSKLKSTYIVALPTSINPRTGRIHTTFSQTRTATGRLASFDPNLQNIPVDGNSVNIRAAFKPEPGHVFLSADYSQIELRVLAYFSQDERLTQAFLEGRDIHTQTTAKLFDIEESEVTSAQRQVGKRINFSILYGLTPYGLSKDLGISYSEARTYIEKYFEQYPGVEEWMHQVVLSTEKQGYVTTLSGRRREIPGIKEQNKSLYEAAKRMAINTRAQGTAAELMKQAMITLHQRLIDMKTDAKILLQIHDELLITVPESELEAIEKLTKEVLEGVVEWNIPLEVSTRVGRDWQEATK